jgi:hypothetical protein
MVRCLGLAVACATATAQQTEAAPFTLPAGQIKLPEFLGLAARYLHWNIVNAAEVQRERTLNIEAPVKTDADGCMRLLGKKLLEKNLALLSVDAQLRLYTGVALSSPMGSMLPAERRTPDEVLEHPVPGRLAVTVVRLQHAPVVDVVLAVRAGLPMPKAPAPAILQLRIAPAANGRGVLLRGFEEDVAKAIASIRAQDEAAAQKDPAPAPQPPADFAAHLAELDRQVAELELQVAAMKKAGGR